jgi:hypothetical protein
MKDLITQSEFDLVLDSLRINLIDVLNSQEIATENNQLLVLKFHKEKEQDIRKLIKKLQKEG